MTGPVSAMVLARGDGEAACHAFRAAGFEVGPLVDRTFSITGSRRLFEKLFGKGVEKHTPPDTLPSERLPPTLRAHVELVTFSAPLDFGPTEY